MTTADQMPSCADARAPSGAATPRSILHVHRGDGLSHAARSRPRWRAAVENNDTGYAATADRGAAQAYADFAAARWGWQPIPSASCTPRTSPWVIVEALRRLHPSGEGVVLTPPVYAPVLPPGRGGGGPPGGGPVAGQTAPRTVWTCPASTPRWPRAPARCCCATPTTRWAWSTTARSWRSSPRSWSGTGATTW
ncbi:hypothetical protein QJS66_05870 [Kocuria rhizophila]|nr:hypothetical protein QJS66_05870 [Kocuria rhizophila]